MNSTNPERAPLLSIALISAAALAYEVLLTRIFAVVHWHHLVATSISLALLGYGVSGTFLALAGERLRRAFRPAFVLNALLFTASGWWCVVLAQRLSFDPQALAWDLRPLGALILTYLLLALPFFAAANCIGLALWRFPKQIPRLYGVDLLGAGLGVLVLLLALSLFPPGNALVLIGLLGLVAASSAAASFRWPRLAVLIVFAAAALGAGLWGRIEIEPSAYKDLARTLNVLGAEIERQTTGVSGQVSVVRNDQVPLRSAPGLSLLAREMPPRQLAVFVDGDASGTLLLDSNDKPPEFLRDLSSALPYALLREPRTLILGAGTGLAVRQALLHEARAVLAVETNPLLVELVCDPAGGWSADLCRDARVSWRAFDPRALLAEQTADFDLIVSSAAAEPAGLNSQHEDFGLTVEAFTEYLAHLSDRGILAIDGATRLPPRLALRLVATAQQALQRIGAADPAQHLAMIRAWQRFTLLVKRRPLTAEDRMAVRTFARQRGFDLVWLSDLSAEEVNRYQQLAEPAFFDGVRRLMSGVESGEGDAPQYRLAPATDDSPFPYRFSRWDEFSGYFSGGASQRGSNIDLGFFLGSTTLVFAIAASLLLILLPLVFRRRDSAGPGTKYWRWRTVLYFGLIGLAFLFIEIAWIHRLQRFLGQPIYATAFVLAVFLIFAGLGSVWSQSRPSASSNRLLVFAVAAIVSLSLAYLASLDAALAGFATWPLWARVALVVGMLAPLAFAMGIPFPLGLRRLSEDAESMVPWAWGINGCASVVSAVAAPLLAMEIGFSGLVVVGGGCYLALLGILPRDERALLTGPGSRGTVPP